MSMKPIPNFPGYFATKDGRIYSGPKKGKGGHSGRFLKPAKGGSGYLFVGLYRDKRRHHNLFTIHRLVLETFVGPCPEGMEGCHDDGNKQNNSLGNLRWDTRSNNILDTVKHGTHNNNAKLNELQVRIIRRLLEFETLTQYKIAEIFRVAPATICRIKTRECWNRI